MLSCGSAFVCVLKQEQEETQRRVWMWRSGETIRRATKMSIFCDSCLRLMGAFNGGRNSASRMWMKSYTVPTPPLPYSGCFSPSIGVHKGSAWKFDTGLCLPFKTFGTFHRSSHAQLAGLRCYDGGYSKTKSCIQLPFVLQES